MVKFTTEAFVLIVSLCSQLSFAAAEIRITDGALAQKAFVPTSGAKERLLNFSLVFSVDCIRQHWLRSAYDDPPDKTKLSKKSSADTQRNKKTRRRAEDEPRWRSPWYVEPSDPATNDS